MLDIITSAFVNSGPKDYLWLAVSLSLAGAILIIVNYLKEIISERLRKRRVVNSNLRHLLKSSQYLTKKVVPMLLQPVPESINDKYLENTAYRIAHFLATMRYFQRSTFSTPVFSTLTNIEMFLERKIPMSMRGNIYHHSPFTSENQEDISLAMYEGGNDISPVDFHKRLFFRSIDNNPIYKEAFDAVVDFLTFDKHILNSEMNLQSPDWRWYVALCHFCVYLIDLYSILGDTPEWEEFR